jgi:hypothetical protein
VRRAAAAFLALALAAPARAARAPEPFPAPRSDARVELLGALRLLAHDDRVGAGFYRHGLPYERALETRLAPFAGHPAVSRWLELERAGLNYVVAYQWVLTLGDLPDLSPREPAPGGITRAAGGPEGVEEFRLLLADFARASDFARVYRETAPLRAPMLDDVRAQSERDGIRRDLERYWGAPLRLRYDLIVSDFVEPAVSVTRRDVDPDGVPRLTSLSGAETFEGRVRLRLNTRRGTLWALAAEEGLRAASAASSGRLKRSSVLLEETGGLCATTWEECSRKEAAFAVATRLLALAGDRASAEEFPVKFARIGMPHIAPLVAKLKDYEAARRRWRTVPAFYPELLGVFESLASSATARHPFAAGISAALADPAPCALILPDAPSPALKGALARFRRSRRLCDEELTATQALGRRFLGVGIVAVGALPENAWLRERWRELELPARLDAGRLVMHQRPGEVDAVDYAGRIGFVSTARNPDDPARPVLLFTAEDPALVPPLLDRFSPVSDYEILDGTTPVKTGVYEKSRIPWRSK